MTPNEFLAIHWPKLYAKRLVYVRPEFDDLKPTVKPQIVETTRHRGLRTVDDRLEKLYKLREDAAKANNSDALAFLQRQINRLEKQTTKTTNTTGETSL